MTATSPDRHAFGITAALLAQGERLDALSRMLTAILLATLLLGAGQGSPLTVTALIVGTGAGIVELYLAARVGLDAALFVHLGKDAADGRLDLLAFDAAMTGHGLAPPGMSGRPIARRCRGARRLLVGQASALLIQVALALGAALALTSGASR